MSYYGRYAPITIPSKGEQIVTSIIVIIVIVLAAYISEILFSLSTKKSQRFITLFDYTANSDDTIPPIRQDISTYSDAIPIGLSVNERTGIEFAYSFYLFVNATTFTEDDTLKHVFHKGYSIPWPLMGPGVFIRGNSNTMRVFMNTSKNPYTYIDIKNIPVQKWFHVVLNCYKGGLDVYINGNLANRLSFSEGVPYHNFQDIIFFSKAHFSTLSSPRISALPADATMNIAGSFHGNFASLKYARYALSVFEIQKLMGEGPSKKQMKSSQALPPYLADSWWTEQN